ncbi:MAG: cation transporter [Bacteroidales bacterium]|nr:cation transporter [Bacteroidales bacterium]
MAHDHSHIYNSHRKAFAIGIVLNILFVGVEVAFGIISNSSALLADAGHNASDILGLALAWTASRLAMMRPRGKYTYGLRKTTILTAILNAFLLFAAVAAIAWDAFEKLQDPSPVAGGQVMIVAGIGVVVNSFTALLFLKGQKHDLNIRGAFLHMIADAAVSLGVVMAGLFINITGRFWIDPLMSFIIIAVVLYSAWGLFIDSVNLALDAVPKNIDIEEVREFIKLQPGVESLHDLHIWAISTTQSALTVHLVMPEGSSDNFISMMQEELKKRFNIGHTTFQIERGNLRKGCGAGC